MFMSVDFAEQVKTVQEHLANLKLGLPFETEMGFATPCWSSHPVIELKARLPDRKDGTMKWLRVLYTMRNSPTPRLAVLRIPWRQTVKDEIVVRIKKLMVDADMRRTRSLILDNRVSWKSLRQGEVILMINRAGTLARMIDCHGGIYSHWADPGEVFDVNDIQSTIAKRPLAIGIRVVRGRGVRERKAPKRVAAEAAA